MTLKMTVHHGDYRGTVEATAGTARECLLEIIKSPQGIGYAPKPGSDGFDGVVARLERDGRCQFGWGDYEVAE